MKKKTQYWSYSNGGIVPNADCAVHIQNDSLGTMRGMRVFSTAVAVGSVVFRLTSHLDRIILAAKHIGMQPNITKTQMQAIVQQVLAAQETSDMIMVRLILSGQSAESTAVGMRAEFYVYVSAMPEYSDALYQHGVWLGSYPHQRELAPVKLTNYVAAYMARQQLSQGVDSPVYVTPGLNPEVLEGDTYNIVFVDESGLVTPPADGRILVGITRQCVAKLAEELGIGYREAVIPLDTIHQYSECFMTTSLRFLMPVRQIDETPFSVGHGTTTARIQAAFKAMFHAETGHCLSQLGFHSEPVPFNHGG
jgi:branched-chain amino acid aminotransferase